MLHQRGLGERVPQPGSEGECGGKWGMRAGELELGNICISRLLLPVQLRRQSCDLAVSKLDRSQLYPVLGVKMYLLSHPLPSI